jgi:hypothetical protein
MTQRRRLAIAMDDREQERLLRAARICRLATVDSSGQPSVTPVWFWWDGEAVWVRSLKRSQRWSDVLGGSRVALVIDDGADYGHLRGVELRGRGEPLPDMRDPVSGPSDHDVSRAYEDFATKYGTTVEALKDGRHGWLWVAVDERLSWDHTKLGNPR